MTWLAGTAYCGALLFFVLATKLTSAANAIFLQAASPLYVLILSPWLLKERLRPSDFLLMAALATGLLCAFLSQPVQSASAPNPALGNILGSFSGLSWGSESSGMVVYEKLGFRLTGSRFTPFSGAVSFASVIAV